jgi:hypothetical protein
MTTTSTPTKTSKLSIAQPILFSLERAAQLATHRAAERVDVKGLKTGLDVEDLSRIEEEPERWDGLS